MKKNVLLALLCGLIFTVPSNLFLKFYEDLAYANGLFIDYLLPKIYLSDVFVMSIAGLQIAKLFDKRKFSKANKNIFNNKLLTLAYVLLVIRQYFAVFPEAAIGYALKLGLIALCAKWIWMHRELLKEKVVEWTVYATLVFQSMIGLYQFFTQRSVAGYWLFGEPTLPQPFGLANITIGGAEKIAPYGTTAHPNILGGVLAVYLLFLLKNIKDNKKQLQLIKVGIFGVGIVTLLLTGSISALLAFGLGCVALMWKKRFNTNKQLVIASIIFFLIPVAILFLPSMGYLSDSVTRRYYLEGMALALFAHQPIFGIGLNQFTPFISAITFPELVRFVQPVHHVGLLWLTETGLVGTGMLVLLLRKISLKKFALPLLLLAPIAALDHYLLTQQSGLLLSTFTLIYFYSK